MKISKTEVLMIIIFLSVIWFGWAQFQGYPKVKDSCWEGNQCEIKQCGM